MRTSIEIAHVYGDETFGDEQKRGLAYARHLIENVEDTFSTVILVDDVHAEMKLDIENYVKLVELEGVPVDAVILESNMIKPALDLMERLTVGTFEQSFDRGARKQKGFDDPEERWIALTNDGTPSCACLSAASHLVRFAGLAHPFKGIALPAVQTIINVLPQRFMTIEEKALQIINHSAFKQFAPRINHIFHG